MMKRIVLAHKAITVILAISFVLMLTSGILTYTNYGRLAPLIVLHFDALHGVDTFGTRASIWGMWALGLTMNILNGGLAYEFYNRERFLAYLYLGANVLISLIALISVGVMVTVN